MERKYILNYLIAHDMLDADIDDVLSKYEMTKRENIIKTHIENVYHIWQNQTSGRFITYLPDDDKPNKRRQISSASKEALENQIIKFYLEQEKVKKKPKETLSTLYPEWLEFKKLETRATTYIRRIDNDWNRYYKDTSIVSIPIAKLTTLTLKEWALKLLNERHLTKRQFYNMAVIIRQELDYAVERGIIQKNLFREFVVDKKLFAKTKKPDDETQVFLLTEQPLIEEEAYRDFKDTGNVAALSIPLAFQLGVRLGELVALRDTDMEGNYIHIQRMEARHEEQRPDGTWKPAKLMIVDYTKTDAGDRLVYCSKRARDIIQQIVRSNMCNGYHYENYLFVTEKGRVTSRMVSARLKKYCDHININRKSSHKIRKTVISALIDGGVNINRVREQSGHTSEKTTYNNYCFNRKPKEQTEQDIEDALAI